jgi:ABC-type bacteriocin/lantibiotic exporter with double-glycine peptidase domain
MFTSLVVIISSIVITLVTTLVSIKVSRKRMEYAAKERGLSYALISGIQKIKLAGAEKRAFAKWAEAYTKNASLSYNPPVIIKLGSVFSTAVTVIGTLVLYFLAVKTGVSPSEYMAFNVAYGLVMGAFTSLMNIAMTIAQLRPILEMAEPILKETPELTEGREILTEISGGVELNNVSFRYNESMPYVINGLNLKIRSGEYLAVVGKTGCGKSTLVRLLLGFEKPERGAIYYGGKDINAIDLRSLRKKIGAVTQDGGLFQGDIYSNIVISAPQLSVEDAWKAAEIAGIADDIRSMPMGMNTVISEGQGGISGGQKQRLMIARAVAPKPAILIFDEATSALDNKTQKQVSEALDKLKCTRIIIAHRLSTIKNCDRIIVLDNGNIIEDGKYEDLISKNGYFAELVKRQRLDTAG